MARREHLRLFLNLSNRDHSARARIRPRVCDWKFVGVPV